MYQNIIIKEGKTKQTHTKQGIYLLSLRASYRQISDDSKTRDWMS